MTPKHYDGWKVGLFIHEQQLNFSEGNVVKYVCRWRKKDGLKDLYKARDYLDHLIKLEELEYGVRNQTSGQTTCSTEEILSDLQRSAASSAEVGQCNALEAALNERCEGLR